MLHSDALRDQLRVFSDSTYASFTGFPTTITAARTAWGSAFSAYFAAAIESIPPATPGNGQSMTFSDVSDGFSGHLSLAPGIGPASAATDFSNAWAAGVGATKPGPGYTDPTGEIWTFAMFNNIPTLQSALQTALVGVFTAKSSTALDALQRIAAAMHAASAHLMAQMSVVTPGGPITNTISID